MDNLLNKIRTMSVNELVSLRNTVTVSSASVDEKGKVLEAIHDRLFPKDVLKSVRVETSDADLDFN